MKDNLARWMRDYVTEFDMSSDIEQRIRQVRCVSSFFVVL